MTGLRNRLAHAYFNINHRVIWEIVHHDLPALIERLEAVLAALESK